jgi:uncharacterized protein (TIGR03437 family)
VGTIDSSVCKRYSVVLLICLAVLAGRAHGQNPGSQWRHVGGYAVDGGPNRMAGTVSGAVDRVWYASDGATLYVRTASAQTYQTTDLESWTATNQTPGAARANVLGLPPGAAGVPGTIQDLAVSPRNPDEISVATDLGIFRSADAGKSWTSLNDGLPNLPVVRLWDLPEGGQGVRIELTGMRAAEWPPGEKQSWLSADNADVVTEAQLRAALGALSGVRLTAVAVSGNAVYAGTADGQLRASSDRGQTWQTFTAAGAGAVERIWVNPADTRVAIAVFGKTAADATVLDQKAHVLHTISGGVVWDNVTANLPDVATHGVTADAASGAIYVATDAGVFVGYTDLASLGGSTNWTAVSGLPAVPVVDVKLDGQGNQLWAAVQGFGVYATLAPHRYLDPRVVNAADLVARAVAPGSLISILGAQVSAVRAGDVTVPVLNAAPGASQLQVPFDVKGNTLSLTATVGGAGMTFAPLVVAAAAPSIFTSPDGMPMLLDGDSGVMLDAMTPAHSGGRIQILASGLGRVTPEWPTGLAAPAENTPRVAGNVSVYLDRTPVEVTRAILAPGYVGLYLVEITVPKIVNYGPAELYVDMGGAVSNRVRVYIEP